MLLYSKTNLSTGAFEGFEVNLATWSALDSQRFFDLFEESCLVFKDQSSAREIGDIEYKLTLFSDRPGSSGLVQELLFRIGTRDANSSFTRLISLVENTCARRDSNGNRCSLPLPCSKPGHR